MKFFQKIRKHDGTRELRCLGLLLFRYKRHLSAYQEAYARRFEGLTPQEERLILEHQFEAMAGYPLNLDNPRSFNEKIQWLKLYYRHPLMTLCSDKVAVRDYIKDKIGAERLVPIVGTYERVEDIPWESLPERFVAKVNWGSGQNIIVKDKAKLDITQARAKLEKWMRPESNHYYNNLEWCYKDISPKIIIEEYIENFDNLKDYKFFCFGGKARLLLVCSDRETEFHLDFYDMENNLEFLPITYGEKNSGRPLEVPRSYQQMIQDAERLAQPFPFVRVDFYETLEGKPLIGELTFYSANGTNPISPREWDYKFGDMIELPEHDEYTNRQ